MIKHILVALDGTSLAEAPWLRPSRWPGCSARR